MSIVHSVVFVLKHEKGSAEEKKFFEVSDKLLAHTPFTKDFRIIREVSPKNKFDYGFTMTFESRNEYDGYNACDTHQQFLKEHWFVEVDDFMETDWIDL